MQLFLQFFSKAKESVTSLFVTKENSLGPTKEHPERNDFFSLYMADRVYPSTDPTITNGSATATRTLPATKSRPYGATRPAYSLANSKRRSCSCCSWITIIIISLIILAAIAGAMLYLVYRPHRPSFVVSGLKVNTLSLSSASKLTTNVNLDITTTNRNKKFIFIYNPIAISATTATDKIVIGNGKIPFFIQGTKNTTLLKSTISSNGQALEDASASKLETELKSENGVDLKIDLDTRLEIKAGGFKTPKTNVRVSCEGIKATVPGGTTATTASVSNAKCKVDLRIKIWKWTF